MFVLNLLSSASNASSSSSSSDSSSKSSSLLFGAGCSSLAGELGCSNKDISLLILSKALSRPGLLTILSSFQRGSKKAAKRKKSTSTLVSILLLKSFRMTSYSLAMYTESLLSTCIIFFMAAITGKRTEEVTY